MTRECEIASRTYATWTTSNVRGEVQWVNRASDAPLLSRRAFPKPWSPLRLRAASRRPSLSDLSLGLGAVRCLPGVRAAKPNVALPNGLTGSTRVVSRGFGELARRSDITRVGDSHAYRHQRPPKFLGLPEHVPRCAPKKVAGVGKKVAFRQDVPPIMDGHGTGCAKFLRRRSYKISAQVDPKNQAN